MRPLKGRSLLGINELTAEEILFILETAKDLKVALKEGRPHEYLRGKSLAGIFGTQSTRTSCSFETGMTHLGGHMMWLGRDRIWSGSAGAENWHDTIKTITRYVNGIAHRPVTREQLEETEALSTVPVINASCPVEHPTQSFADVLTMQEHGGGTVKGAKVAFLWGYGELNPPAGLTNSTLVMAAKMGFNLSIACPDGMDPDPRYIQWAKEESELTGSKIEIVRSYEEATKDADFINVYSWVSPEIFAEGPETGYRGNPEFAKYKQTLHDWCVTKKVVDTAPKHVKVMHCLPAARNEEVTDEVLDGDNSIIFDEAENRLHTIKALLTLLLQ
ncbi:MAG: ornithine carbamoyltransferase [Lachnospiraceae bacterium]|jgi:ornithine carbamoyltransferase|nr:ornithine carbamoyltransferase [Lachnospiraceae bacterium]